MAYPLRLALFIGIMLGLALGRLMAAPAC